MNRQPNKITAIYTRSDYAITKGLDNIQIFSDCGYNGIIDNRPDFQKLLAAILQGNVSTIIVRDTCKLYRDKIKRAELMGEVLPQNQVALYALEENITPEMQAPCFYSTLISIMGGAK